MLNGEFNDWWLRDVLQSWSEKIEYNTYDDMPQKFTKLCNIVDEDTAAKIGAKVKLMLHLWPDEISKELKMLHLVT